MGKRERVEQAAADAARAARRAGSPPRATLRRGMGNAEYSGDDLAELPGPRRPSVGQPDTDEDNDTSETEQEPARHKKPRRDIISRNVQLESEEDSQDEAQTDSFTSADADSDSDDGHEGGHIEDGAMSIEQQVADVPFEVLEHLRRDGTGPGGALARAAAAAALARQQDFKRANRHRPSESSSKRPVSRFREVIAAPSKRGRDPRFDALALTVPGDRPKCTGAPASEDAIFRKRYSFLFEDVMPQEKQRLREQLKKEKSEVRRLQMQGELTRIEQRLVEDARRRKQAAFEAEHKAKEKAAVAEGKRPYYLKASERKKLELKAKYEELKAKGGLDKYMEKRRRRNAAKDHRYVPGSRRDGDA